MWLRYNRDMSKSSSSRKKSPRSRSGNRKSGFWRFMFRACVLGLVLLAGWMVYLDAVVTSRFEGRRFEVSSRVYARPLELYDGASVTAESLKQELELAGYRSGDGSRPGTWQRSEERRVGKECRSRWGPCQ